MQHLKTLVENPKQKLTTSNCDSLATSHDRMQRLAVRFWARMSEMYGTAWTLSNGTTALNASGELTEMAKTWAGALQRHEKNILTALDGMRVLAARDLQSGKRAWPPSLIEFEALCLGRLKPADGADWEIERRQQAGNEMRSARKLAAPVDRERAKAHIAAIRAKLGAG